MAMTEPPSKSSEPSPLHPAGGTRRAPPGQLSDPGSTKAGNGTPNRGPAMGPPAAKLPAGPTRPAPGAGGGTRAGRAGLLAALGAGLVAVVGIQVALSIAAGVSIEENPSIPSDLYHRVGVPFGSLGATTVLILLAGVVISALPHLLGREATQTQAPLTRAAATAAIAIAALISVGSLLAVLAELNNFTAQARSAPTFVRLQLGTFLLGALGSSALTIAAGVWARRLVAPEPPAVGAS